MEYKLYKSPWKALRLILLCSCFVIPSIYFLVSKNTESSWVFWVCILFFGLGYPVGIFNLLDKRPQIIVNEIGIFDRSVMRDFINWEIISDAYLNSISRAKFICLVLHEDVDLSGKINGTAASLNRSLGFQELNINLSSVKVDEEKLLEFTLAMIQAEKPQRQQLILELAN